ncbi:MAG: hypothetical protein AAF889_02820 [Cyanobacteria bacterium P01_D01_bin.73]
MDREVFFDSDSGSAILSNSLLNPYGAIGLRGNPFVAEGGRGVPKELWVDRGWSKAPVAKGRQFVQVMGEKGFGKTSHLKHWRGQTGGPYCYYPPGLGRLRFPAIAPITYWDEADRIPLPWLFLALAWSRVVGNTVVVGTHRDLRSVAVPLGFKVAHIDLPPLDAEMLMKWAAHRIQAARLPGAQCSLALSQEQAGAIAQQSQGSWRTAGTYLHIWAADAASTP